MPTDTFVISAAGNDGTGFRQAATWAGIGAGSFTADDGSTLFVSKLHSGSTFFADVSFLRFDTSALPEGITVTGANLLLFVIGKQDQDTTFGLVADYYDFGGEPSVAGDWIETASPSILAATDLGVISTGGVNTIALSDFTGISTSGFTGIRLTLSAGTPGSPDVVNSLDIAAQEHASQEPRLEVTYTEAGVQQLRPDADIVTTGWATAPLWSKIDEESADGTVITATAS